MGEREKKLGGGGALWRCMAGPGGVRGRRRGVAEPRRTDLYRTSRPLSSKMGPLDIAPPTSQAKLSGIQSRNELYRTSRPKNTKAFGKLVSVTNKRLTIQAQTYARAQAVTGTRAVLHDAQILAMCFSQHKPATLAGSVILWSSSFFGVFLEGQY